MNGDGSIELLAPAGSFDTALAAFDAGADAVYLGLGSFSARADAVNFTPEQLRDVIAVARDRGRRVYVTFNTLIDQCQLADATRSLALLEDLAPDGIIVQDLGVARIARRDFPGLALHASTQLVAHNLEGALALRELGFTRIVLARELPIDDIRSIAERCGVEIEVFVHGALCYSISGLCLFSAMEKNRSGNRGRCAYCCRLAYTDAAGVRSLPFSMRDLRLDDSLDALRGAGVASLKIEGRMKSPLYVASVTSHYRQLLDGAPVTTTRADLETVFSRRTTRLYADGYPPPASEAQTADPSGASVIDPSSLGHLGTPIGTVKRLTKDREGRTWLRFHTNRSLERHDGLQFLSDGGKPYGFGISDMRTALSRASAFSVPADSDVEILMPPAASDDAADCVRGGATVFCSASSEMKRRFPAPSFRPSDFRHGPAIDMSLALSSDGITAKARAVVAGRQIEASASIPGPLSASMHPERTMDAARKAFSRLGGTQWTLGALEVDDPDSLFAPASALNELRRAIVERLDAARAEAREAKAAEALTHAETLEAATSAPRDLPSRVLKIRLGQKVPDDVCLYDELVVAIGHDRAPYDALESIARRVREGAEASGDPAPSIRVALPVFTRECDFGALRGVVRHLARAGISSWEAADLATLRLLRQLGFGDVTADWTLYAFNAPAIAQLAEMGVSRAVASPENVAENLDFLASFNGPVSVEFLELQSTPLFISLTRPAATDPSHLTGIKGDEFSCRPIDGLWITTRPAPTRFRVPDGATTIRTDLSWSG